MQLRHPIFAILVAACAQPETGIDRSVIQGTVEIPPLQLDEGESTDGANDSWEEGVALDLGPHGPRYIQIAGQSSAFGPAGDLDFYRLTPLADGTLTLSLRWDEAGVAGDTGAEESALWRVFVHDTSQLDAEGAPVVIFESPTEGGFGQFDASVAVTANTTYAIAVRGQRSDGIDAYELVLGGFDPNDSGDAYVAAWENADPADRGLLLGGTRVESFELDEETLTWSGSYTITDIRSVVTEEVGTAEAKDEHEAADTGDTGSADTGSADTGGADTGGGADGTDGADGTGGTDTGGAEAPEEEPKTNTTVNEKIATVWLHAGTFSGLTAGPGPGVLYATEAVEVKLSTKELTEDLIEGVSLTLDDLMPVPLGWTTPEEEPNDVEIDDNYTITGGEAQALPVASGPGLVDVVRGTLSYAEADPSWEGDNDAYIVTVDEPMTAFITLNWEGSAHNVDLNLNDSNGEIVAVGWDPEDVQPETLISEDWGVTFQPGTEYTLIVLPWSGPAAELPYSLEIEWFAAP